MATFIMFTRLSHHAMKNPEELEKLEREVSERIFAECDGVEWVANYAVLGPNDYVDIFKAPDIDTATKVATLVRTYGHAHPEVWPATEWAHFKEMLHGLPGEAA